MDIRLNQQKRSLHQVQLKCTTSRQIMIFQLPDGYSKGVVRSLGRGSYGTVIWTKGTIGRVNGKGEREEIEVAVKKFHTDPKPELTKLYAKRCYRELRLLQHLKHENIARILDLYTEANYPSELGDVYLVMEYVGSTLEKHIDQSLISLKAKNRHIQLDMSKIPRIMRDTLNALLYLKAANVLHRDLKPSNLAITGKGKTVLLDFGLARTDDPLSDKTAGAGTPCYASPEISFLHSKDYGHEVHMWSVGCILFELLTLIKLFENPRNMKETINLYIQLFGTIDDDFLDKIPANAQDGINGIQKALLEKSKQPGFKRVDLSSLFAENNKVAQLPRDNATLDFSTLHSILSTAFSSIPQKESQSRLRSGTNLSGATTVLRNFPIIVR